MALSIFPKCSCLISQASGRGRWNDKKQSLFCQGQHKAERPGFDLDQQQPLAQSCGHLPARTRPQEFLAPKNATCFATHQRKGGRNDRKKRNAFVEVISSTGYHGGSNYIPRGAEHHSANFYDRDSRSVELSSWSCGYDTTKIMSCKSLSLIPFLGGVSH